MSFDLSTNLSDLPYGIFHQLAEYLDAHNVWPNLFNDAGRDSAYNLTTMEVERYRRMADAGAQFLRQLGNRGETVLSFLTRLNALAKIYGDVMDRPQLVLRRKFHSVIWSRPEQILIDASDQDQLKLTCKASGFPTPQYQWMEEDRPLDGATGSCLHILRCPCTTRNVFRCRIWNAIESAQDWSAFYRAPGKVFESERTSDIVDLSRFAADEVNPKCAACKKTNLENICRMVQNMASGVHDVDADADVDADIDPMMTTTMAESVATDKVALIISNRTYAPRMSNLLTPHCDAESLADALQQLKFKTVTLGDLRVDEMRFIIQEYRKLFGDGVYAVFYFVGHGFEANGQCYLLPIGAPAGEYGPEDCVSMDWVMSVFRDHNPALNLIILDICRKFLPSNLEAFNAYAERFRQPKDIKINRNTVYGYATSGGVGAYEIRGEINGIFMKYLKRRIAQPYAVLDMLKRVFRDVEKDKKVCNVQIPELRSNLTQPRSLLDPLVFDGHTNSYDHHTIQWRLMHELPTPVYVTFEDVGQLVTVWFDFCGHFTNKVYVFSNVGELPTDDEDADYGRTTDAESTLPYFAHLKFTDEFDASSPKVCIDDEEGVSLCVMLSNLQRSKGELHCTLELRRATEHAAGPPDADAVAAAFGASTAVASKEVTLGHVLITRLVSTAAIASTPPPI